MLSRWIPLLLLIGLMCAGMLPGVAQQPATEAPPATAAPAAENPEASRPWNYTMRDDQAARPAQKPPSTASRVVNAILNLVLVLVVAYLVMLGFKHYMQGTLRLPGTPAAVAPRALRVLETVTLAQGRTVHLLRAGGRTFLVGATAQQITLLSDVTGDDTLEALESSAGQPVAPGPFASALAQLLPTGDRGGPRPAGR